METFMAIVFLVFGILQIILFFKIWGMTNNVKKIKNKLCGNDFPAEDLFERPDSVRDAFYANTRKIDKLIYLGEKEPWYKTSCAKSVPRKRAKACGA